MYVHRLYRSGASWHLLLNSLVKVGNAVGELDLSQVANKRWWQVGMAVGCQILDGNLSSFFAENGSQLLDEHFSSQVRRSIDVFDYCHGCSVTAILVSTETDTLNSGIATRSIGETSSQLVEKFWQSNVAILKVTKRKKETFNKMLNDKSSIIRTVKYDSACFLASTSPRLPRVTMRSAMGCNSFALARVVSIRPCSMSEDTMLRKSAWRCEEVRFSRRKCLPWCMVAVVKGGKGYLFSTWQNHHSTGMNFWRDAPSQIGYAGPLSSPCAPFPNSINRESVPHVAYSISLLVF